MNIKEAKKAAGVMREIINTHLAEIVRDNPQIVSKMEIKTIRYGEDGFKTTLDVQWVDGLTDAQRMYDNHRELFFGLPERGTTFVSLGHAYWIDGMKMKRGMEWVIAHDSDNRSWLFKPADVLRLLSKNPLVATYTVTDKKITGREDDEYLVNKAEAEDS